MSGMQHSRLSIVVGTMVLLLAAGCQHAAPRVASPATPAGQTFDRCRPLAAEARTACYEERLVSMVRQEGVPAAMEALSQLSELDEDLRRDGHVYAHAIGLAAYTGADEVGQRFGECTPIFQSGCYHGVVQAYFVDLSGRQGGIDADAVNALCSEQRGPEGGRWLLFQCVHGLGHGLTMLYGHDLPRALEGCDLLLDSWERRSCYGGAFMENVVNATMPHHPATRSPADAEHGSHAQHVATAAQPSEHAHHAEGHEEHHGGHAAATAPFKALDPENPHYPCSELDERYLSACYQMQTSAVLFFNKRDFAATARFCDEAPDSVRHLCYQSLGRDINSYAEQNHAQTIRLCAVGDPRYRSWCYIGVVKNLVDLTARAEDGIAYCRAISEAEYKRACYEAVGEQIWVLEQEVERREELCRSAEPAYLDLCRGGADLLAREPVARATP
ncbi:hypothetical protein BH24GEM3_BH24GEM3_15280 [soil metagenome]